MKKILLFAFLLVSTTIFAQQKFSIGIRAGVAIPYDRTTEFKPFQTMVAPSVGISAQYDLLSFLTIDLAALYDGKGVRRPYFINSDSAVTQAYTKHSNYLTIPLVAKVKLGKKHKFVVGVGGFLGYLVLEDVFDENKNKNASNLSSFENRFDAGLTFTLGAEFYLGKNIVLSIDPSFDLGLMNTASNPSVSVVQQNTTAPKIYIGLHYRL